MRPAHANAAARPTIDDAPHLGSVKFSAPPSREGLVPRDDLVAASIGAGSVVAVTAPAGYGKTTFLTDWARTRSDIVRAQVAADRARRGVR